MNKNKTKKALASLAIAGMAMTMAPFNAFADTTAVTTARLFGTDRVGTAVAVANAGWTTADTVILAPSADANLVDALAAAPLAGKANPILLTDNNTLTAATKAELVKLNVKKVYVIGAISQTVVDQVNAMSGVTATVLKGAGRTDTAAAIASKLTAPAGSFVVGYGALADALSVASYAAANNYSILVANPDGTLPASEAAYKGATTYLIGGPTLVADMTGATRLFGADRFATNQKVLTTLTYKYDKVYVANGSDTHLVDSLVASSLAAGTESPIVLTDANGSDAATGIKSKLTANAVVTALGGSTVVTDTVLGQIAGITVTPTPPVGDTTPVTIGAVSVTGQKVGTGAKATPAVALVNAGITVAATVSGTSAANANITYLVTSSNNITAKDLNGNTLVDTTLNSPVIIGNDTFNASYSVPADASGNVKATFTSTASSQKTFNVVIEAPFSNAGQPVQSDVSSIEWGAPGTTVLSPVYASNDPDSLNFSTSGAAKQGLVPIVATMLPADGSDTVVSGQAIKFTMTNSGKSTSNANAFYTDATGSTMLASGAVVGKGGTSSVTYVANTDADGQALVYINSNLPADNGVASLGSIMNVGVQAQLVDGGGSSTTGYYEWKAVSQPSKVANVTPSAMLNATGLEGGGTVTNDSAETATSGSQLTIGGTLQDAAGNPVKGVTIAIQDYNVTAGESSNNVQNDAFVAADGTTKLFSAVDYPTVTTDSNGNWSVVVTADVPVTQSILSSITKYYAFYVPPTIAISSGQSLPNTVTSLTFVGNSNSGNFIDLVWQQGQTAQTIGVSHNSLMPNYTSLSDVPQTMKFSNVVGDDEEMYAAAYNQTGTIIAPASGNQFDEYALTYDLTAPVGIYFDKLGSSVLPVDSVHGSIGRITATYTQVTGLVVNAMYYSDGTVVDPATAGIMPYATGYADAYDGSGQLHFYLDSDQTSAVVTSGTAGSVNINMSAYSNTSALGVIDTNHAQGSASGTINAAFTASNTIGSLGVAGDLLGINNYAPLMQGNAAPPATVTVAGVALPDGNKYDPNSNSSFVVAPFNSYPAIATIPSQGLTLSLNADKNGKISNVDGYTLASTPTNVSVNVNSFGEVSVNNVKLWAVTSGYKVVGYLPGATQGSVTLIEQNTVTPTMFTAYAVTTVGSAGIGIGSWTLPTTSLPGNYEGFLGFNVSGGQLQPIVASVGAAPFSVGTATTAPDGAYAPITAVKAYASDKYSEVVNITVTNSLNSQTATVTTNFTAMSGGLVAIRTNPSSVNAVMGGSSTITITAQDAYGNPIASQSLYVGTGPSMAGLWITQVNNTPITGSVNMGTTSSTSMQTINTPVPLFSVAKTPAYVSATGTGLTAYQLNTTPIVSLTTGVDGTVAITVVDGNVNYVPNTATSTSTNSYDVDPGTNITNQALTFYSDIAKTSAGRLGSVQVNWSGAAEIAATGVTVTAAGNATTVINGGTLQMSAAVVPANTSRPAVTWSATPGTGSAVISSTGLLTATGIGTVTVTAKNTASGVTGTEVITVTAATDAVTMKIVPPASGQVQIGTVVTVAIANPVNFQLATQYQVYDMSGNAISAQLSLADSATLFPVQTSGTKLQVQFYDAANAKVGALQSVTLQ